MQASEHALLLVRGQFAFTIGMHIVLAAFTMGLANFLVVLEALWLRTRRRVYMDVYNYWLKLFSLTTAAGVVTGIPMEFVFGLHWGRLSGAAGAVIGPLMFFEVLVAFFLEAGFLGIMLFGMKKVGHRVHFFATCMVALGSLVSAFWILSANSWLHTPAGFARAADGNFLPVDWLRIIFNPSFPWRMLHMSLAALLATAAIIAAVGAWHVLRDTRNPGARLMFSMGLWVIAIVAPLQLLAGDLHGRNTLEHQPQKLAAIEGSWQRPPAGEGEPLRLFAIPDMQAQRNRHELAIPRLGSLYLRHNWTGTIAGLREFPRSDLPPVPIVFFAFRAMVGLGLLLIAVGMLSLVLRARGRLYEARWLQRVVVVMAPSGMLAMLCGWVVTEVGRQPFTVYGLLRTAHSTSPLSLPMVASSSVAILVLYPLVFGLGLFLLLRVLRRLPHARERGPSPGLADQTGN
ncbi:cytochrome ubiquinol oxidase subunit I [Xanthomonas campestris pv. campestris]|uniref:Cytochrome D oxidase subunit A n=3 Tax=Xanthomonas campestris pv. campestris TaxID=340 RepID=Q8P7E9_XANCP|nr:cytochrome ubiquinol oxidase subunit I [Xanthomonas campestris]AAM41934.1 cytochrome D oxidase subunit A [Xanthomonas campestris pv. campestris str. ATCC 33913]AAY48522.1 cytochrome D oxidase subunit A [Xanthomonas campestris pv. campestris str. 8004]AKS19747.1 cytochrome D ubiquinol oxidase subunit I [Xanthomonas campestris pv. campestris]ALE69348.1 cytochrome D ubiquinol oxidase subunit I [Xanthomonas campestris pv. campestris]MBD8248626.1 cytochrome ubiquinol oxidase subunit I [Xanthomon